MVTEHEFNHEPLVQGELLLFRTLWQTSNDNMFIVRINDDGDYVSEKSNRSLEATFGLHPGQLDGVLLKAILQGPVYEKIAQRYDRCIAQNTPITYEEEHVIDDSGSRVWSTTILPVYDRENHCTRILGVSREITSLKKAEQILKQHNKHLEHEVSKRTEELSRALREMEAISVKDKLTGLFNRHKLDQTLADYLSLAGRYQMPFGLIIVDLDNFKEINDTFGHHAGDHLLQAVADIMHESSRKTDIIGRWGGDEFLIIVPHADEKALYAYTDHIRSRIQNHSFAKVSAKLTVSAGATLYQPGDDTESILLRADKALYDSKNRNKNRVTFK
ncbi:sensor domain-containing diguanylate cyclase [Thiomicrorhabdus xiamenensis]|uniref:diguanylate cyclase n=1 Tax=Thiomicrorhabdus xiamenensis TaxID=2739063 RepID=A0A7D4NK41_9GAMM|nr:sensor domain-containing diguanylate cyclase [Thiomicrorhabdus xiamenensis]QKI88889.1 diguanylate cyclase [Thiomicrorhabdus xiamenensis]